ncbi:MAG TPA: YfiR family protein [Ramlibacter sp.]|nr:YfiR family protein [Ramlibacter sp.]
MRLLLVLLMMAPQCGRPAWSADAQTDEAVAERRVKAAYLYRFASYVEWPNGTFARPDTPLSIGVWGDDELADDLAQLVEGRTVDGRRVVVRSLKEAESFAGLHIVFIAQGRMARLGDTLESGPRRGTLIVTDTAGALQHGSVLNFVRVDGQIRFEVSLEAAKQHELKLSSRLAAVSTNLSVRR